MPLTQGNLRSMSALVVMGSGILLAACAGPNSLQTFAGGSCQAFPRPEYQIKGKTKFDQIWADRVTEAGVAGCHWQRPKARPVSWDATVVIKPTPVAPEVVTVTKPSWLSKLKHMPK